MILLSLFIVGLSLLFHNPALSFLLLMATLTYGSEYAVGGNPCFGNYSVSVLDSTHFVICYADVDDNAFAVIGVVSSVNQIAYGTPVAIEDHTSSNISTVALDSTHFAVMSKNTNEKNGQARVGVVSSGNVITFGDIYTFHSTRVEMISSCKIDSTHFVITYNDYDDALGESLIATLSNGDDLSFGSVYTYCTGSPNSSPSVSLLDSTHFVIAFSDVDGKGKSIIGVISSTTVITYGDLYYFNNAGTYRNINVATLDSTHFVIFYCDYANSLYHTAIVGTVSNGDEIAYGSEYSTGYAGEYGGVIVVDSTHFIATYIKSSDTKLYSLVGTISNVNQVAFSDTDTVVNNAETWFTNRGGTGIVLLDSGHLVIAFRDTANSGIGKSIIGTYVGVVAPTVTTQAVSSVDKTTATGNGNITATGGANCTRRGFCYKVGTSGDPTTSDSTAYDNGDYGTGAYTKAITGLTAGTGYRVRAYAINSAGTSYGDTVQLTTLTANNFFNFF